MKRFIIACLLLAGFVSYGNSSQAVPIPTQLTLTGASGANLFITALNGTVTATIPFDITGTLDLTIDGFDKQSFFDGNSTYLAFDRADIQLSDESLNPSLGFLGGVSGSITGAGIKTLDSNGNIPLTRTNQADPFEYTFDPGGGFPTALSIDQGLFTYNGTGPVGGLLGSGTVDFSSDPVAATLGSLGQVGLVTQDVYLAGNSVIVDVVVSAPLTFADTILTDPVEVGVDLSGVLVATGTYVFVPEPSTIVLMSIALVVLMPLRRRLSGE